MISQDSQLNTSSKLTKIISNSTTLLTFVFLILQRKKQLKITKHNKLNVTD